MEKEKKQGSPADVLAQASCLNPLKSKARNKTENMDTIIWGPCYKTYDRFLYSVNVACGTTEGAAKIKREKYFLSYSY